MERRACRGTRPRLSSGWSQSGFYFLFRLVAFYARPMRLTGAEMFCARGAMTPARRCVRGMASLRDRAARPDELLMPTHACPVLALWGR